MTGASLWNVFLASTTVVGFALAIWQAIRAEQLNRRQRDLDWPRFRSAASDLARSIDRSDFVPDMILALSDRGAMVAHLVARELRTQVPVMTATYLANASGAGALPGYNALRSTRRTVYLPEKIGELGDRRVLLVDDFTMSGDGMSQVRQALISYGLDPQRIRSATLVATKLAIVAKKGPDY